MVKYVVSKEYLNEVCAKWSSALSGRMKKRVELKRDDLNKKIDQLPVDDKLKESIKQLLFDGTEEMKNQIGELLFENVRDLKLNIRAFSYGVKFIKNTPEKKS